MKVKNLIKLLMEFDDDALVYIAPNAIYAAEEDEDNLVEDVFGVEGREDIAIIFSREHLKPRKQKGRR